MNKKIIARCCICDGPVYSDGTTDCNNKSHEIDLDKERNKFFTITGLTPEEYLEYYNQDSVGTDIVRYYYLAVFLSKE